MELLRDVNPGAADIVAEQHPHPAGGAWIEARIPFECPPQAVREALRMGADMEILEPAALRAAVEAEARIHAARRKRS